MKLGNIINIKHGYAFKGENIITEDNNIVLVTPGNFMIGGGFKEDKCKFFNGEIPQDYILKEGDLIVTMTDLSKEIDTLGYSALIPKSSIRTYLHNQRIGLVSITSDLVDKMWLYYYMHTRSYQKSIANTSTGSTVHHTSPQKIYDIQISLPPLSEQRRIAGILSSYDDLIANYRRQIALLEEAAQRLYHEWFVALRFPGYQTATFTHDGLPQGWRKRSVNDFGKVVTGKTPSTSKKEYYNGNIPFVTIPDMHGKVYPIHTEKYLSKTGADTQQSKYLPKNAVIVSCIATVGLVNIAAETCQTNQQINSVILNNEKDLYFFYESMKGIKMLLSGIGSNGATMTNVNKTKFENVTIIYPTIDLIELYYDFCKPIFENILTLQRQLSLLTKARDGLLAKLMNNEIAV